MRALYKYTTVFSILALSALALLPAQTRAQAVDPVRFIVAPETPGPNELVSIEVEGVGSFLGSATITWQKDGKTEKSGVGERTYSFTTGALGSRTTVRALINSPSQGVISRDFVFAPSLVNLVWEADTYTPMLYQGHALYSAGSSLRVVAYPTVILNGARVSTNSMVFQWRRNDEPVPAASGLGRTTFSFEGDQLQAQELVGVDVYIGSSKVGRGEIVIPASAPLLLLYERDPLRGVNYERAFPQAISLSGREITIQAEPYFFSQPSKQAELLGYSWTLNGQETAGPDTSRGILTLRQSGGGAGSAVLSVEVQNNNENQLVQQASAALQIVFGGQQSSDSLFPALGAAVANFNLLATNWTSAINLTTPTSQQLQNSTTAPGTNYSALGPSVGGNLPPYQFLEPLPTNQAFRSNNQLSDYLATTFRLLLVGGALFAVAMLTVSGIRYMLSEVGTDKAKAKTRIRASIYGLLLLMTSVLILQTINPRLLEFNLILPNTTITSSQQQNLIQSGVTAGAFTYANESQTQAISQNKSDKNAFYAGIVNTGDRDGSERFIQRCEAGPTERVIGGSCAAGAVAGGTLGFISPLPGGTLLGATGGCVVGIIGSFYGHNPTVESLPGDIVGDSTKTVLTCSY